MQNTFDNYNPSNDDDVLFDRDDLVGIALGCDDPIFKRHTVLKNMYNSIIDESVVKDEINSVTDAIENGIETDESVPEPDYEDIMPDDSDFTQDGMDAEDEIESAQEVLTGEADEDMDILDFVDNLD